MRGSLRAERRPPSLADFQMEQTMIRAVLAVAGKDLRLLLRNRAALFFTLGWPVITAVLFGLVFSGGGSSKLRIAVSDLDQTPASQEFAQKLIAMDELEADVQEVDAARQLVRTGKRTAAVVIPRGFGTDAERVFYGSSPRVELVIDPSRKAETAMMQGMLQKLAGQNLLRALRQAERTAARLQGEREPSTRTIEELDGGRPAT